jgi:hypothetical protein
MKDGNIVFWVPTKARDSSVHESEKRGSRIHPISHATNNGGRFPRGKLEPENDHLPVSSEEDENKWSHYCPPIPSWHAQGHISFGFTKDKNNFTYTHAAAGCH